MKTLWTFGCSYTESLKAMAQKDQNFGHYSTFCQYKDWRGGELPSSWPDLLSQKLNYELKNKGQGSSSNYQIFSQFCKNVKNYKEGDMIIIGWANVLRFRCADPDKLVSISPGHLSLDFGFMSNKTIEDFLVNRTNKVWAEEIWDWMFLINEYALLKKIDILYWTSDPFIFVDDYSMDKFILVNEKEDLHTFIQSHETIPTSITSETKGEVNDGHCGEFGHKLMADLIYEHIKNKGII